MRRRLFTILSALSLLLCVAVVGMWVRSYWYVDFVTYSQPDWAVFMEYGGGQFRFEHYRATAHRDYVGYTGFRWRRRMDRADGPLRDGMMMPGSRSHVDRFGFWVVTGERWGNYHHAAFVPAWFLFLVTSALPAAWGALRVRKSNGMGLCPSCGYDLRATPERCPECGRVPTPKD